MSLCKSVDPCFNVQPKYWLLYSRHFWSLKKKSKIIALFFLLTSYFMSVVVMMVIQFCFCVFPHFHLLMTSYELRFSFLTLC